MNGTTYGGGGGDRTAFHLLPVHQHRARGSTITAVALSADAAKVYVGLSDGQLEEHRIAGTASGAYLSLTARKHVSKKPVKDILHLEGAARLAALCDGSLLFLDADTLEGNALPGVKGVTAVAADPDVAGAPRLALALKTGRRAARVAVYRLLAGAAGDDASGSTAQQLAQMDLVNTLPIKAMAWLGGKLVVCTSLEYLLLDLSSGGTTPLFSLPAEAPPPTLIQRLPGSRLALLLMDQVGIIVDARGAPATSALTFPTLPSALAATDLFVVAAAQEGLSVFQWGDATCVQQLSYGSADFPAPGEPLLMANAAAGHGAIAFAGHRKVWLLREVALQQQAAQLLRSGDAAAALALADAASAPWAQLVAAEATFLLIHSCRFREAFQTARRCSPSQLQPRELFSLAPQHTAAWRDASPQQQTTSKRWGLAPPLLPLELLVARAAPEGPHSTALLTNSRRCLADYLLWARKQAGVQQLDAVDTLIAHLLADLGAGSELAAFAAAGCSADLPSLRGRLRAEGLTAGLAHLAAAAVGHAEEALGLWQDIELAAEHGHAGAAVRRDAAHHAAALLADSGRVDAALVLRFLPWLARASPEEALTVLKGRELPRHQVMQLLQQAVAPAAATSQPSQPTVGHPDSSMAPNDDSSSSSNSTADLQWQYLEHLVNERQEASAQVHTQLAAALATAALSLLPPGEPGSRPAKRLTSEAAAPSGSKLAGLRERLQDHLKQSQALDVAALLGQLQGSALWQEQVILHSKAGGHQAALRILALVIGDMAAAEAYCAQHLGPDGYGMLLEMLLQPAAGAPPLLAEACHLLHAAGEHLESLRVLQALPQQTSLAESEAVVAALLQERIHRCRQGAVVRSLLKADALAATAHRAEIMSRRVVTSAERACQNCHSHVSKIFAVYPNGANVCFKCYQKSGDHIDPVTRRDFRSHPGSMSEAWPD